MSKPQVVTGQRIEYDYVVVEVEPYESVSDVGKPFMVSGFLGWVVNRGQYVEARGRLIKKDGSLGAREFGAFHHVPAEMSRAVAAVIEDVEAH